MTDKTAEWYADKELKRDKARRALAIETDPKKRRSLRGAIDRWTACITMGPIRTSDASVKARETMRRGPRSMTGDG